MIEPTVAENAAQAASLREQEHEQRQKLKASVAVHVHAGLTFLDTAGRVWASKAQINALEVAAAQAAATVAQAHFMAATLLTNQQRIN